MNVVSGVKDGVEAKVNNADAESAAGGGRRAKSTNRKSTLLSSVVGKVAYTLLWVGWRKMEETV